MKIKAAASLKEGETFVKKKKKKVVVSFLITNENVF